MPILCVLQADLVDEDGIPIATLSQQVLLTIEPYPGLSICLYDKEDEYNVEYVIDYPHKRVLVVGLEDIPRKEGVDLDDDMGDYLNMGWSITLAKGGKE